MIRYDETAGDIRIYASANPAPFEDYVAFCTLQWWSRNICCLRGLRGEINRRQMAALVEKLIELGADLVYAQRAPGRRIPYASLITDGDFAGMWRIDLGAIVEARARRRG